MELLSDINGELVIVCVFIGVLLGWLICHYQHKAWYYTILRRPDKHEDKRLKAKINELKKEFLTPQELKDEGL